MRKRSATTVDKKLIILGLISAAILISFLISQKSDVTQQSGEDDIQIEDSDVICESDEDCVSVFTDCSGCDCGSPVNKKFKAKYESLYKSACNSYRGPVCELYCPPEDLRCESNKCVKVDKFRDYKFCSSNDDCAITAHPCCPGWTIIAMNKDRIGKINKNSSACTAGAPLDCLSAMPPALNPEAACDSNRCIIK